MTETATKPRFKIGDRKCVTCGHVGPLKEYVRNNGSKFGHKNVCLTCSGKGATSRFPAGNLLPTIRGVELSDTSLAIKGDKLKQRDWEAALGRVVRLERGAQWWVGDLLAFGERANYGDMYTAAVAVTGRSLQTLKSYTWVSRHVAPSVRRPELPWRSHRLVAPLPEDQQREWLTLASEEGWSSDELQRELKATKDDGDVGDDFPDPEDGDEAAEYRCPHCAHEWDGEPRPEPEKKPKLKVA
jgi:hypothetical protein